MVQLIFNQLINGDIFEDDFKNFNTRNILNFHPEKVSVLYGPNGTGKTSLAKTLSADTKTSYEIQYKKRIYTNNDNIFHVINDQNVRNIIQGDATDFIVSDNIKLEQEKFAYLSAQILAFRSESQELLKNTYGITKASSIALSFILSQPLKKLIQFLANSQNNKKEIDEEIIIAFKNQRQTTTLIEQPKLHFIKSDFEGRSSIIDTILTFSFTDINGKDILTITEDTTAIEILENFSYKDDCIVCESSSINHSDLRTKKASQIQTIHNQLNATSKKMLEHLQVQMNQKKNDPFEISKAIFSFLTASNLHALVNLKQQILEELVLYVDSLNNDILKLLQKYTLIELIEEYRNIVQEKFTIDDDDFKFVQTIIRDSIDKELVVEKNKNQIIIKLEQQQLLEIDRNKLQLSNGEQNFISLAFELLKAKKVKNEFIVIDDPISSFDSIFKNKIAFAILKFLNQKKVIILTHNAELIRLLHHQQKNSFGLYILNNTPGEENGFIHVTHKETEFLLSIPKFIDFLKDIDFSNINDKKAFYFSLIPFLRGYADFIRDTGLVDSITKLMHGYMTESVDISNIFNKLIKPNQPDEESIIVKAADIVQFEVLKINIFKNSSDFPLLERTLYHTLNYLHLRMNVEHILADIYQIDTEKFDMLGSIIAIAFKESSNSEHRVFFNSKKTLINDFNHFDSNLNIYYPALDITDKALEKERSSIFERLEKLKHQRLAIQA